MDRTTVSSRSATSKHASPPETASWRSEGNRPAKTVVMIQCVGSRDADHPYCSRVCCADAVKNALKIKALAAETHVYVLYRDIRTYGFKESYYTKARQQGVVFVRYDEDRKPEVSRNGEGLQVTVYDQTSGNADHDLRPTWWFYPRAFIRMKTTGRSRSSSRFRSTARDSSSKPI
jgi:heterodisulfide reductase subunit A-like polyferredoxin